MSYLSPALGRLFIGLGFAALAYAAPPSTCGTLNAGVQIFTNIPSPTGGSNYSGALKMAVWYPTTSPASPYVYALNLSGLAAQNAPIATCAAKFPMVVFSHGWSGCGTQIVYLTEQLARLGYIVAAPDHQDHGCAVDNQNQSLLLVNFDFPFSQFGNPSTWTDQTGAYRNVDINTVMNYMLNLWTYKSSVDTDRLAISGHSFGGYTAFAKVGGWNSWLDPRFKAGVFYSPHIEPFQFQVPNTILNATVPKLYMTGDNLDPNAIPAIKGPQVCPTPAPCPPQPGAFEQSRYPKYYGQLLGSGNQASHLSFSNLICTDAGYSTIQTCLANDANAQLIVNYTVDFLDHFLTGQQPQWIWSTGVGFATYWQTGGEPSGSYLPGAGGASQALVTLQGDQLTSDPPTAASGSTAMPLTIGQTSATVTDSVGTPRPAPLYYVSPSQINLVVPNGTANGPATIAVNVAGTPVAAGPVTVNSVAPSLLPMQSNMLAGWAQQGSSYINIWSDSGPQALNVSSGGVYLVALGTGLRGAAGSVTATVGNQLFDGTHAPQPVIAGSPQFEGLDQIAIGPLPASLSGSGLVNVTISVAGQQSNTVQVLIK